MIKSIELDNWKTHKSTKLTFARGTNILIGRMGAGKSSVMDAISFALFGTFPAIQHRRVSINDLIRSRPKQEKSAAIRLDFDVDGINYSVERNLGLKESARAKLEKEGTYVQSQPERVSEEIEKVLKVDYDLFSKAVYSEQNRLDYFLELRASDRKKQIDGLLGLDRFATAQENTISLTNKIRDMIEDNEKTLAGFDAKKLRDQLKSLEIEKNDFLKEAEVLKKEADKLKQSLKSLDTQVKEMREKLNRKNKISNEITELRGRSALLEREIKKAEKEGIQDKPRVQKELEGLSAELEKKKSQELTLAKAERELQKSIADAESRLSRAKKDLQERNKLAEELKRNDGKRMQEQLASATTEIKSAMKEAEGKKALLEENKKWLVELEKHLSKCPVCERELTADMKDALVSKKKDTIAQLDKEVKDSEEKVKLKQVELDRLNDKIAELTVIEKKVKGFEGLDSELDSANKDYEAYKKKLEQTQSDRDNISKQITQANESVAKLRNAKELAERIENFRLELAKDETALKSKETELKSIDVDEDKLDKLQSEFAEASSKASRLDAEIVANTKYAKEKQLQIENVSSQLGNIERLSKDIEKKRAVVDSLIKFRNSLEETQAVMRSKLVDSINSVMKEIWPELYPYEDYTDIALVATEDDYTLKIKTQVENGDGWQKVDAIASGGERSIAALAMRVALALVLVPNLRWLILDEPTHNIDQRGLQKFVKVFNETLPKIVDQVFIITHDEALKDVSNANIYMLEKNDGELGTSVALY